jgi:hypothetical protein
MSAAANFGTLRPVCAMTALDSVGNGQERQGRLHGWASVFASVS